MKSFDEVIRQRRLLLITWHMFEAMIKRARLAKEKDSYYYSKFYYVFHISVDRSDDLHYEVASKVSAALLMADHPGAAGPALNESEMNYLNIVFQHCYNDAKYDDAGNQKDVYCNASIEEGISYLQGLQAKIAKQMSHIDHWIDGEGTLFMC
jgi:hypothetical protein